MEKIKNVITALGDQKLNIELKKNDINVIFNDIQYKEGILEYLERNKDINYIIINDKLPGNLTIKELVKKIKTVNSKIRVILITEKHNENVKVYQEIGVFNIEEIKLLVNSKDIFSKMNIPSKNLIEQRRDGKIITILGPNGIGKSIFSITFANNIKNKKILIIDFDVLNNSLHTLLGVKQYSKKIQKNLKKNRLYNNASEYLRTANTDNTNYQTDFSNQLSYTQEKLFQNKIDISDFIIKTKFKIDLISGINLMFDSKYAISSSKIRNIIKTIKQSYDLVIIDTSSECFLEYTKELIRISNYAIFISGANLLEIKKAKNLLEIYTKEWKIENNKLNLVFNKCTNQSIGDSTLKQIFKSYNILGKIKLSDYYDLAINNNNTKLSLIQKDLEKIRNRMLSQKGERRLKIKKIKR